MMWTVRVLPVLFTFHFSLFTATAQDSLWVRFDDRFRANTVVSLNGIDSFEIKNSQLKVGSRTVSVPAEKASVVFSDPGRILLKPNTYSGTNYTNDDATTGYNFAHSLESEHFAVFWDVRYGSNPSHIQYPGDGNVASVYDILDVAERCWNCYVDDLGFIVPGQSTTDKYKVQLYIPYQKEWRADASGTEGASGGYTGIGHFNPWAAVARGGHTVAHEVGHTFQYLVSADLGTDAAGHYDRGWRWGWARSRQDISKRQPAGLQGNELRQIPVRDEQKGERSEEEPEDNGDQGDMAVDDDRRRGSQRKGEGGAEIFIGREQSQSFDTYARQADGAPEPIRQAQQILLQARWL